MAEVVDSIVANLEVRYQQYVEGFDRATAAHGKFKKSIDALKTTTFDLQAEGRKYGRGADDIEKANNSIGRSAKKRSAEEIAAAEAVKKAARDKATAERAAAKAAADAVKAAEREKQAALKATQVEQEKAARAAAVKAEAEKVAAAAAVAAAEREAAARARLAAVVERSAARSGPLPQAVGGRIGATVPREATGQQSIPLSLLNGTASTEVAEAAAAKEVNHLLADRFDLQQRIRVASGAEKQALQDQASYLLRINTYKRAGLAEDEAILRAEKEMAVVASVRSREERKKATSTVGQFARGAGVGYGGVATAAGVAGLATAVGVGVGVEVIQSAVDYGKAIDNLGKQLGITVEDLQAYQKIARDTGVSTEQLTSAFGQFASNLGRAQQGSEEQAKVFAALGVNIRDFKSAGDALPTVIDRISQLQDPLSRAAIETRLFGEEGRRLDPLLSGGAARVSELAESLQETGRALSASEIQELDQTARKLAEVKSQLSVDFARIVAGNADAIIALANSFATLADRVVTAIGKLQQFGAAQIRNGIISNFASDEDKAAAKKAQLSTKAGRVQLYGDAEARERNILAGNIRFGPNIRTPADAERERQRQLTAVRAEKQQIAQYEAASRPAKTDPVQTGNVNQGLISKLGAPKPPKGPKGKSAEQIEREEEQRTRQFNDQLAGAQSDFLRAQEQMTANVDRRAEIEAQLLQTAYEARVADIESQRKRNVLSGADEKLEAARAAELTAAEKKARDANLAAIEQDKRLDKERALTAATQSLLEAQAGTLSVEISMARTTAERRRKQLQLLDNQQQQEGNRLAGVINSAKPGDPAAQQAIVDFGRLQQTYDAQRQGVLYDTRSQGEQYRDAIPRTADQMNEALDSVKVHGLQSLDDALTDSISKVFKLGGAFGSVANSIISDLIRIGVQRAIIGPLADSLFGKAGGDSGGGKLGGLIKSVGSLFSGARASGGNVVGGNNYLVGENGPEIVSLGKSGRVYPNGALPGIGAPSSGGGALTQHITIDARNSVVPAEFAGQILQEADARAQQHAARAGQVAVNAAPGRVQRVSVLGG